MEALYESLSVELIWYARAFGCSGKVSPVAVVVVLLVAACDSDTAL